MTSTWDGVDNGQGHLQGTKQSPANLCLQQGQASCGGGVVVTVPPLKFGHMAWPAPGCFGDDSWGPTVGTFFGRKGPPPPGK